MTSKVKAIRNVCSPQRVVAGFVFLPLLAYAFPPFLVSDLPFGLRLLFWASVMMIALAATWIARKLVQENLVPLNLLAREMAFAGVILALFTPALWVLAWALFTYSGQMAPEAQAVAVHGVLLATGLVLVHRSDLSALRADERTLEVPRIARRLPASFNGRIYRLTVKDHSVDVVTSEGTFTIRSRFTDAIDEMEPVPGHCSHRSHWVTDAAIVGVERADSKIYLRLINGDLIPVSRKYRPMLEADGIICS